MNTLVLWIYRLVANFLPESRCFGFKNMLLRLAGAKVGKNVRIYSSAHILGNGKLEIGDDVHIGAKVLLYPVSPVGISLGSHVDIAPCVTILTGSHRITPMSEHMAGEGIAEDVSVSDGCWLGACATILPGVTLPRKTIVAAGSVVIRSPQSDKESHAILLAGVPATIKKNYSMDLSKSIINEHACDITHQA